MARRPALLALLLLALATAGCGGDDAPAGEAPLPEVVVALDFLPNAVHAPVFAAVREGLDRDNGVRLTIQRPGSQPDSLKALTSGRADLGLLDIHDLAIARERGVEVVGVGALVGRPLAALLAQPEVRRPRDLEGQRVGVSGLPSDPAFVRALVEADGGRFDRVELTTIGFQAVSALASGRVAAVPAFWNAEGVALRERGERVTELRVERYGAPAYPEVVLMATPEALEAQGPALRRALAAIADGVDAVRARPEAAVTEIAAAAGDADPALVRAQLAAVQDAFAPGLRLDREVLEAWARWDAEIGLVDEPPDVDEAFLLGGP